MKKKIIGIVICTITSCVFLITTAFATNTMPGTTTDPLVTKSYVDTKVSQIMSLLNATGTNTSTTPVIQNPAMTLTATQKAQIVTDVVKQLQTIYGSSFANNTSPVVTNIPTPTPAPTPTAVLPTYTPASQSTLTSYVPVQGFVGQTIIGGEGTEIILRSGSATSYQIGSDGLVNATTGQDLQNGSVIDKNNIIIVPRYDGRGVKVTSDNAWFMIKGYYQISKN